MQNPAFGGAPILLPNRGFESETLVSYELGYRIKPVTTVSFDAAGFYNDYDNLRSVEPVAAGARAGGHHRQHDRHGHTLATATPYARLHGHDLPPCK